MTFAAKELKCQVSVIVVIMFIRGKACDSSKKQKQNKELSLSQSSKLEDKV